MKFCVITIIKDEQQYLEEWIEHHINLGIDRILIYEDIYSTSHKDIVDKFDSNIVELKSVSELNIEQFHNRQQECFRKIVKYVNSLNEFDWLFYIDVDEFITLENSNLSLTDIFNKFSDYQIVKMFWKNYNANGHIEKPIGKVQDNFTQTCQFIKRHESFHTGNKLALNLRNDILSTIYDQHTIFRGKWCNTEFSDNLEITTYKYIYIKHYITKSFEEFVNKILVRGQFYNSKHVDDFFELNPEFKDKQNELFAKYSNIITKYSLPKIIHYTCFTDQKSNLVKKCINGWKELCSDYKFIEWNKETIRQLQFNIDEIKFLQIFLSKKNFNAVSDLITLKVLLKYGGIYLSNDIQLFIKIPELFLEHNIMTIENNNRITTAIFGVKPMDKLLSTVLMIFDQIIKDNNKISEYGTKWSINNILTNIVTKNVGNIIPRKIYNLFGYVIYPTEIFYPKNKFTGKIERTNYTIAMRHYEN